MTMLTDGSQNTDPGHCICGQSSNYGSDWDQVYTLTFMIDLTVKTIITTNIPRHTALFSMDKNLNSAGWTSLCTTSTCVAGTNDFATQPDTQSVTFDQLKITFVNNSNKPNFGICEIWAYAFKNYAPLSTITYSWDTSVIDSKSHVLNGATSTTAFAYISVGKMLGDKTTEQYQNYPNTCNWIKNEVSSIPSNTVVLVTLPKYLEIQEIYHHGGEIKATYYLGDPVLPVINAGTAQSINDLVKNQAGGDAFKFSKFTSAKMITGSKDSGSFSVQCSDTECTDFATNKIIITNEEDRKDFYICGFGIMAKIPACPPSTNQCSHSQLLPMTGTIATVNVVIGSTITTPSFTFSDALSSQCSSFTPSQQGCTSGRTYTLKCFKCSTCSNQATCSGAGCAALAVPTFTHSFASSGISGTLTIAPTNTADAGSYSCQVSCDMNANTQNSNSFTLQIQSCSCSSAILTNTVATISALTPSFPNNIAVGQTGASSQFTAPTNSATLCSGIACPGMQYALQCKDSSLSGAVFATPQYFSASVDQTNANNPTLKVSGTMPPYLHGKTWNCQQVATLGSSTLTSNTFTIKFDACISAAESCPHSGTWTSPTAQNSQWAPPLDILVYPDNTPVSTTFDYSKWKDPLGNICSTINFCGTPTYSFGDATNNLAALPFAAAVTVTNDNAGKITFTVQTSDINLCNTYQVGIKATLTNDVVWTGTRPSATWNQFIVQIVNPCDPTPQCKYTKLIASTVTQTAMTIKVDGVQKTQNFPALDDFVSTFCSTGGIIASCNPAAKTYVLIDQNTNQIIPADLGGISSFDSSTLQVTAGTMNFAYTGVYTVFVQASVNLQYYGGTGVDTIKGNTFTITVDACSSCAKTTLIALGSTDTQPSSYSIGVENTPGFTLFTPFQNQAAKYCQISTQCGTPTYTLFCVTGCTSSTTPFSQSITVDASGKMKQSSWTIDSTLAGTYTVKAVATLDLSSFGQNTPASISTNTFVITIDACSPLPCNYNSIIAPIVTTTGTNHLPGPQVVLCNNTIKSDYFTAYRDTVSVRCSGSTYSDMCGAKQYVIEQQSPPGTAVPFTATITQSGTNTNQLTSLSTADCALVNIYNVLIHASFVTPTVSNSDNTEVKFIVSVEYPDPCSPLICTANTLSPFDSAIDKFPADFSIWVNNTWGTTNFSNFRDSKSDLCDGKAGKYQNGTLVTSFSAPVCGYPTYTAVLASNGNSLGSLFGGSNVVLLQTGTLEWQLQVRTNNRALDGVYDVQIMGTLLGLNIYSPTFKLTVLDECNPYNCSLTKFYPLPNGLKPQNITVKVGQGFVTSNQALWTDGITAKCSNAVMGPLCGQTQFELLLSDGSPAPFSYTVSYNTLVTQVNVEITDPLLVGIVYTVYLQGYGLDSNNLPFGLGKSSQFTITVAEADSVDYGSLTQSSEPVFDTFPTDQTFITNTTYEPVTLMATASELNGTIVSISASLGTATSFVTITNQTGQISFTISYSNKTVQLGVYVIKVTAEDEKGTKVSKSFKLTVQNPIILVAPNLAAQQKSEMKKILDQMKLSNDTDTTPVTAKIESININGLMVIKFSAAVVPVGDVSQLSIDEVYLMLEQNSFEADQTVTFTWTVTKSTPFNLFIQLGFRNPLDISQGSLSDRIRVWLKQDILMIKDTMGMYKGWVEKSNDAQSIPETILHANPLIQFRYLDFNVYWNMVKNLPQQVLDIPSGIFLVKYNLNNVDLVSKTMFWCPFFLQVAVPQAMEKTWLMFGSLQVFNIASQMNLKVPANVANLAMYLQKTANSQFFENDKLYGWLRTLASDRNVSIPQTANSTANQTTNQTTNQTRTNSTSRNLNSANSNVSEAPMVRTSSFEDSKFFGHGSTEKVIESAAQMLIGLFLVGGVFLSVMFFQKVFLHWMPARVQEAFHAVKRRFFYSLPLRILSQQYTQVTLGALINMKLNSDRISTEQKTNYGISVFIIMFYSLLFPAWMIYFIRKHRHIVTTDQVFVKEWNSLFLKVDLRKYHALFLLAFNIIKRFLLLFVAVQIRFPLFQLIFVLYIQTGFALYVMMIWPMEDTVDNQTLIFNELILTTICVILFSFTQYVPDAVIRYQLGWITIYLVYLLILITSGIWAVDFYKMLRLQYLILKQKHEILKRKQRVNQHNKIVDVIGRHNPDENNIVFKRRTAVVDDQLQPIESLASQEVSGDQALSVIEDDVTNQAQTIAARKIEFQQQMAEMKKQNDFNEDVKIYQVLNNLPQEEKSRQKKRMPSFFDDIFKDLLPQDLSVRKVQEQVQKQTDWPISPRHAQVQKKMEVGKERQEQWSWDNEIQGSNASQWNAVPSDFSQMHSAKSSVADELKTKNKHVGKISKLDTKKQGDEKNSNLWISMDSTGSDKNYHKADGRAKDDILVFEKTKKRNS